MDAKGTLAGASGRVEPETETESNAGAITEFTECKCRFEYIFNAALGRKDLLRRFQNV